VPDLTPSSPAAFRARPPARAWAAAAVACLLVVSGWRLQPLRAQEPPPAAPTWQPAADTWLVFASGTCEECEWLKTDFLPALSTRFGQPLPPVAFIDTDDIQRNYPLLGQIEDTLGSKGGDLPAFVVGATLHYGKKAIAAWGESLTGGLPRPALPEPVRAIAAKAHGVVFFGNEPPAPPALATPLAAVPTGIPPKGGEVASPADAVVLYFETTGCKKCARAEKQLLYALTQAPSARVARVNALQPEGRATQYAVTGRLGLPPSKRLLTPMFANGDRALFAKAITDSALVDLLRGAPAAPFWTTWNAPQELAEARRRLQDLGSSFTLPTVLLAGLIDGVNPCAFAVVVFLVSYLTLSGRLGRRFALLYGLIFSVGVFTCYFLIGLGFFQLLDLLESWQSAMRWVFVLLGVVCVAFGIGGVIDTVAAARGGAAKMKFGMPKALHRVVHRLIREDVSRGALGLGAFLIGIAVSGIELVCTGQIYLPVIVFINSSAPGLRSLGLLTLYNLAFILPLLVVVCLSAAGLGSDALAGWARRHAVLTRALTCGLVFGLAAVMFVMAVRG
jgi:cytochrome c biogenesis protein CcdA